MKRESELQSIRTTVAQPVETFSLDFLLLLKFNITKLKPVRKVAVLFWVHSVVKTNKWTQ